MGRSRRCARSGASTRCGPRRPRTDAPAMMQGVWGQGGPIAIAVVIALAIRAMVIESYYVPSGSMLSTMFIGDHVFVSKFVFGAHVPFVGVKLPALRDPRGGEITVFALGRGPNDVICPLDQCPKFAAEGFVKRIVGLP